MALGHKIYLLREERSLSQKELANRVGVTTGTIAEWEAEESAPNLIELSRLSKALNVSSDVLLDATTDVVPALATAFKQETDSVVAPTKWNKKKGWIIGGAVVLLAITIAFLVIKLLPFSSNSAAIEIADASVVTIFCYDYDGELAATGSGFVAFDSKTIITNYHVMTSAYTCKVSTNQDISYQVAKILCYSKEQDIAILQLAKDTGLRPLTLGDSGAIKKGETVVAIGSPLGIKNTVSTGVLSGRLMEDNMDILQFTAPISSGSSGGALFDDHGKVIGITYASYINGQNLNLAIPIELAVNLYESKGTMKEASAICLEENPHVAYLEQHKNIPEVTLTDLQIDPEKYDNKVVKLITYVSSFYPDPDGEWKYGLLYVSEKNDVSFSIDYDCDMDNAHIDFQNKPCMKSWLVGCAIPSETIKEGDKIVVIGEFSYTAKGEHSRWNDYIYQVNIAHIDAMFLYIE